MWTIHEIKKATRRSVIRSFWACMAVSFCLVAVIHIGDFMKAAEADSDQGDGILFIFNTEGMKQKNFAFDMYLLKAEGEYLMIRYEEGFTYEKSDLGRKLSEWKEKRMKHKAEVNTFNREKDPSDYFDWVYSWSNVRREGFPRMAGQKVVRVKTAEDIIKPIFVSIILFIVFLFGLVKDWFFLGVSRSKKNSYWAEADDLSFNKRLLGIYLLTHIKILLWTILLIIPGIIKELDYLMVPYILRDNPRISAGEAWKQSTEMMKGNRRKAFLMGLSYLWLAIPYIPLRFVIGWAYGQTVAVMFSVVFLALFVYPFTNSVYAHLYVKLKADAAASEPQAENEPAPAIV